MSSTDLENLQRCLLVVSEVRNLSGTLWRSVAQGAKTGVKRPAPSSEQAGGKTPVGPGEKRFLSHLKALLDGVASNIG